MQLQGLHSRIANAYKSKSIVVLSSLTLLVLLAALTVPAAQAQTYTYNVVYRFAGPPADGANAYGNVIMDAAGNLYGFTQNGGAGYGTVYKIDTSGTETVLHAFNLTDGSGPQGDPVMDTAGNIYGITAAGGALFSGTIFKLDTSGNLTVLYDVPAQPRAGLTLDKSGNLYGTTFLGGDFGNGTVFKLDTTGTVTVLHSFGATATDGILPTAPVTLDAAGNIYGTTENGGANTYGTVFKIDSAGNYSVVHDFTNTDGAYPSGALILDTAGNIYGSAYDGGANGYGSLFKIDTAGNLSVLHSFTGADGWHPSGDLVRDAAGNLYGTTTEGGGGGGEAFKLDTAGNVTALHVFAATNTDGDEPVSGLLADAAGNLYGTTLFGGSSANNGTVFKLTPPPAQLNNFTAQVLVDRDDKITGVTGQFTPSTSIDPSTQTVSLSVAGTRSFNVTFAAGSFHRLLGTYVASGTSGTAKITMLFVPLRNGSWSYSAAIKNFTPGSNPVTVRLTVGGQSGNATVNAHIY